MAYQLWLPLFFLHFCKEKENVKLSFKHPFGLALKFSGQRLKAKQSNSHLEMYKKCRDNFLRFKGPSSSKLMSFNLSPFSTQYIYLLTRNSKTRNNVSNPSLLYIKETNIHSTILFHFCILPCSDSGWFMRWSIFSYEIINHLLTYHWWKEKKLDRMWDKNIAHI